MTDEKKELYRFTSNKMPGERTKRIVLEGTSEDPKRFIDLGGEPAELTADEVAQHKGRYTLTKLTDEQKKALEAKQSEQGDEPTREQQQASQAEAADAQGPGAESRVVGSSSRKSGSAGSGTPGN